MTALMHPSSGKAIRMQPDEAFGLQQRFAEASGRQSVLADDLSGDDTGNFRFEIRAHHDQAATFVEHNPGNQFDVRPDHIDNRNFCGEHSHFHNPLQGVRAHALAIDYTGGRRGIPSSTFVAHEYINAVSSSRHKRNVLRGLSSINVDLVPHDALVLQ